MTFPFKRFLYRCFSLGLGPQTLPEDPKDIEFMSPVVAATKAQEKGFARILLYASLAFCFIFFIWASMTKLDDRTRAEGKIIPSSHIQRISYSEGGIIQTILVREGDIVSKNQILLTIDPTLAQARYQEGKENFYRYSAAIERLKAQLEGKDFIAPEDVLKNAPAIAEDEYVRYRSRQQKLENEKIIATREVDQKMAQVTETKSRLEQAKVAYEFAQKEVNLTQPLVRKGLSSEIEFLKLARETATLKGTFEGLQATLKKDEFALQQAQDRLLQVPLTFRSDDLTELRDAQNRLAAAHQSFKTEKYRVTNTEIRSPVRGIVKQLLVGTIGGVIQPGANLLELVPLEDTLLIEAKVKPAEIAFLRPGLPATVQITAYDFSMYGYLPAEVINISPDAIPDETNPRQSFFKVQLRTLGNKLSKSSQILPIIPGMTASVDIITGKKTILHKILKPFLKTLDNALREP